jgi:rRNA maturation RNase YbeY
MILNHQHRVRVAIAPLEDFLARVRRHVRLPAEALTICLVSDSEMARWNAAYRGKQGPTDVLSFRADGDAGEQTSLRKQEKHKTQRAQKAKRAQRAWRAESISASSRAPSRNGRSGSSFASSASYLGDIAIAPGVALRNARRFGRTLPEELRILILHGVLHLMGHDHETDNGEMDRRETRLRRQLGLS